MQEHSQKIASHIYIVNLCGGHVENLLSTNDERNLGIGPHLRWEWEEENLTPWEGAEEGVSITRFQQLVEEERKRRSIEEHRDFSLTCTDPETGESLLHLASIGGHVHIIRFLIENGLSPDMLDSTSTKITPLMLAARAGKAEAVRLPCIFVIDWE